MTEAVEVRHDWTRSEIEALLDLPLMDLLWRAQGVHRATNPGYHVQLASLLSVKTEGAKKTARTAPNRCITAVMSQVSPNCRWLLF